MAESDSLTLQRAAAPELCDAMRAEFWGVPARCFCLHLGKDQGRLSPGLQTSRRSLLIATLVRCAHPGIIP